MAHRIRHLIAALALSAAAASGQAVPDVKQLPPPVGPARPRTLRVQGEGRVYTAPDIALVTFGVVAIQPSLAKATQEVTERAQKLVEVLRKDVAQADLQTARYDVQIEQEPPRPSDAGKARTPRIAAYHVSNEVRAKVRDVGKLGSLLDRAVAAGANQVESLQFLKEDTSGEQRKALAAAVRAARAKAEEMVRAAGVQLGEVLEISEGSQQPPVYPLRMGLARSEAAVPVEAGQLEVSAQVEVVFALR